MRGLESEEVRFICYSRRKRHRQSNRLGKKPFFLEGFLLDISGVSLHPFGTEKVVLH